MLIIKTGALGDVLRTTSILRGLKKAAPERSIVWLTAPAAVELVQRHESVERVLTVDANDPVDVRRIRSELSGETFEWLLSFDDERPLCQLASELDAKRVSGAYLDESGDRRYTTDVGPWFDMGLLSVHGKSVADRMKIENRRSHPEIFAEMLGIDMGEPELPLPLAATDFGRDFVATQRLDARDLLIGLNTGAGGRWHSKQLPVERTVALVLELDRRLSASASFCILGGVSERERNALITRGLQAAGLGDRIVDAGCEHTLSNFAAIVSECDLLVTSDSLALHVAVARRVPLVAFFAPTSAAEIELYGRGRKVVSTAPDYCTYARDVDTSTLTVERLADAVEKTLAEHSASR